MINEIYDLLQLCKDTGITIWAEKDKLKYRAEKGKIDNGLLIKLKEQKDNIIKYLKENDNKTVLDGFRLTPIQNAYLIGHSSDYELGNINAHYYTEYSCDNIDEEKLQRSINDVIKNNEALRTVIYPSGVQQVISDVPEFELKAVRLDSEATLSEIRKAWSHHRYQLGNWPMFHFQVSKRDSGADILHFSFDCIILDAWSAQKMLFDIFKIYKGETVSWPAFTFREYLQQEASYLKEDKSWAKAEEYWEEKLKIIPECPMLSFKKQLSLIEKPHFNRISYKFSLNETEKLYAKLKKYQFTPSALVCTVFMKVLAYFSSNKNLTVNLTLFNRLPLNREISKVLGDFTNIGLASYFHNENIHFVEEVKMIQQQFWKLIQYRNYDGTRLLKKLSANKLGKAVMPVVFTSMLQGKLEFDEASDFKEVYAISQTPQVVLDHQARDDNGGLALSWDYVSDAFDYGELKNMFEIYIEQIKGLIANDCWDTPVLIKENCEHSMVGGMKK